MIKDYLRKSNELLDELISQTQLDIANIKEGKHKSVPESVENKNRLIAEFKAVKKQLDDTLISLSDNGKKNLAELLDEEDKAELGNFKNKLESLHTINKEYAKLVIVVKNFFDGLLNNMFDQGSGTNNAYTNSKTDVASLFKLNV
ncbi:flagellar protein FlgN [Campylobacter sp. MIT 12-8780]|uniref:flagellar export chaperone FlgN n=1 Tax=unclassified Campylobacter TaxID=2593542 RepID=UPI0010F85D10|nr:MULTISPECIES: flagellar export chaperone FlgN [unclassified Campylobacter]NDJ28021.1 flagellar protein FlgN [Campylobacter sp. MIT 19-121]TKX28209.1 flagellar protein FlgN [Campylobacter sp. MIT 12-5580]TQR40511.1 flagellar protein FlgN [Campylobacter sp. MIT 12-8780]